MKIIAKLKVFCVLYTQEKFIAKYNKLKEKKEKLNKFIDELRVAKDSKKIH